MPRLFFKTLQPQKRNIENELGYALEWEEMPDGQESRISYYLDCVSAWNKDPVFGVIGVQSGPPH